MSIELKSCLGNKAAEDDQQVQYRESLPLLFDIDRHTFEAMTSRESLDTFHESTCMGAYLTRAWKLL